MSFFYNPHTRQPQLWTYPIFIALAVAVFYAFFFYGDQKSKNQPPVEEKVVVERTF